MFPAIARSITIIRPPNAFITVSVRGLIFLVCTKTFFFSQDLRKLDVNLIEGDPYNRISCT